MLACSVVVATSCGSTSEIQFLGIDHAVRVYGLGSRVETPVWMKGRREATKHSRAL